MQFITRHAFTTTINKWLYEPVILGGNIQFKICEQCGDCGEVSECGECGECGECSECDESDEYEYDQAQKNECDNPIHITNEYVTNLQMVRDLCEPIMACLKRNNYTLLDINQFKEDMVYFMYRLSDTGSIQYVKKHRLL